MSGLIDRRQIVIFAGRPGTGKTPVTTQLGSAAACGQPFLGFPTRPCRIGIIDVESAPDRLRSLLTTQWGAMGLDPVVVSEQIDVFVRGNPDDPNSRELDRIMNCSNVEKCAWLATVTRDRGYDLVMIDTTLTFIPIKAGDEGQVRALFRLLAPIPRTPPYPALLLNLHLRKRDFRTPRSSLLEDPHAWMEEILGSIVWSASADVRIGLESFGPDGQQRVFGGFRRTEDEMTPRIIEPVLQEIDGDSRPVKWECVDPAVLSASVLSKDQQRYFQQIAVGQKLSWAQVETICGGKKSVTHRLLKKLRDLRVVVYDDASQTYERIV